MGFQPSKQGRPELPRLILQSMIVKLIDKLGFQLRKQAKGDGAPWTDISFFCRWNVL